MWLYCVKQLSLELREKCFVSAGPAGNAKKEKKFRVTHTNLSVCSQKKNTLTHLLRFTVYIYFLKMHSQERLGEHYTYFECLTTFFYMFCHTRSHRVTIHHQSRVLLYSPKSTSSCLPSLYSVALYVFSLFYAMKSAATSTDLAIGNTGLGIVGHLGYYHRKHLISYCLHLKPLPKYCQSMAAAPNQTSAFVVPLFLMWLSC